MATKSRPSRPAAAPNPWHPTAVEAIRQQLLREVRRLARNRALELTLSEVDEIVQTAMAELLERDPATTTDPRAEVLEAATRALEAAGCASAHQASSDTGPASRVALATYRRRRRERPPPPSVDLVFTGAPAPEDLDAPAASQQRPSGYRLEEEIVEATPDVLLAAHLLRGEFASVVTLRACRPHEARAILQAYRAVFGDEPANYWAKVLLSNLLTAWLSEQQQRAPADAEAPGPSVSTAQQVLDETHRDLEDAPIAVPPYVTEDVLQWCLRRLAPDGGGSDIGEFGESRLKVLLVDPHVLASAIEQAGERDARRADEPSEGARLLQQARELASSIRTRAGG